MFAPPSPRHRPDRAAQVHVLVALTVHGGPGACEAEVKAQRDGAPSVSEGWRASRGETWRAEQRAIERAMKRSRHPARSHEVTATRARATCWRARTAGSRTGPGCS